VAHFLRRHKATREAIGKSIGDSVSLVIEPDTDKRIVTAPDDFRKALAQDNVAREGLRPFCL
jgi:hypothetical protein